MYCNLMYCLHLGMLLLGQYADCGHGDCSITYSISTKKTRHVCDVEVMAFEWVAIEFLFCFIHTVFTLIRV